MSFRELLAKEPLRLVGAIVTLVVAGLAAFGVSTVGLEEQLTEILLAAFTIITTVWTALEAARSRVASPETAKVLAKGTLASQPSDEAQRRASQVLGKPPPAKRMISPELKEAAQVIAGMTPNQIDDFVAKYGIDALEAAVAVAREALKRAPSQTEASVEALKGL